MRALLALIAIGWCSTLVLAGVASAQDAPPAPAPAPAPAAATAQDQGYILGPEDVIEVEAVGHGDFKARVKIATDGTVQLPYLGAVTAADKTTQQLSEDLSKALEAGGFFSHPILRVDIVSYASRYVTVLGDVTTPGLVPTDRPYHLSDILARVGGLKASAADYVIVRPEKGPTRRLSIKALATGDDSQDPLVAPGDKIFSPSAEIFYISGQIKSPGAYALTTDMTVRQAIARGGGLTDLGTDRAMQVTRGGKKLGRLDLDSPVEAGDVIVIGERLF
jgi:polysaccharide export outer membrane protein